MMAVLELYGKCKELGYCDCEGFFGCVDPKPPAPKPVIENELANAMKAVKAEAMGEGHRKYDAGEPMPAMVECEVCDRSHAPNHPHITNIEGDTPLDDELVERKADPIISLPPADDQLPDWLRDKPAADGAEDDKPQQTCQVCGNPWAPRHACIGKEAPGARAFNTTISKSQTRCDTCGKIKRSNHNCKAQPKADTVKVGFFGRRCEDCAYAGELCVRHGGVWSDYDTPRGATEPVAASLPKPVSVTMPAPDAPEKLDLELNEPDWCRNGHPRTPDNTYTRSDGRHECKECKKAYQTSISALRRLKRANGGQASPPAVDPEIAAMAAIAEAFKDLSQSEIRRVLDYISARFGGGGDAS